MMERNPVVGKKGIWGVFLLVGVKDVHADPIFFQDCSEPIKLGQGLGEHILLKQAFGCLLVVIVDGRLLIHSECGGANHQDVLCGLMGHQDGIQG
jgi:hypothetical protein